MNACIKIPVGPCPEDTLCLNEADASFVLKPGRGRMVYIFGEVFYHLRSDDSIKLLDATSAAYLNGVFAGCTLEKAVSSLEGQYIGVSVDRRRSEVTFFSDRYARIDLFYARGKEGFVFATDLGQIFASVRPEYDQLMLAHMFSVYGWYTPKGHTIYGNVKRLRVGELLTVRGGRLSARTIPFSPQKQRPYGDEHLSRYERILRESVIARANRKGRTWVSSSSGWDSSLLLAVLVDEFGAGKVSMLTGSMKYSRFTETINSFEINKIKKIGAYYGIDPEIVDLDFKNPRAPDYWKSVLPYYRSKHMYSYVSFNFARLSDRLSLVAGPGQVIFNGETSDSFHNFGFSQFATFFHDQKPFTEYADKMNCYLYSPSFLKKVLAGTAERDRVFRIFRAMNPAVPFSPVSGSREDRIEALLFPFFYGGPRLPFAQTAVNPVLRPCAQRAVYRFPFREYMPEALGLDEKTIYAWLIHLYQSFHSQGATVSIQKYAMEYNGHRWRSPFNDYRMIELLSGAPVSWGRGLDFNHTKFPLKWMARNRLKFPYDVLEQGPHSYLYDVIEGFSLYAEKTYRSGVTKFFKETLAERAYRELLSDRFFDTAYLDRLVSDYLRGREARGIDFTNLVSLITLSVTGWY